MLPDPAELINREPVLHRPELIWDDGSFETQIAGDFREIGASGACYERQFVKDTVLARLAGAYPDSLADGYRIEDAEVVRLGVDIIQVRYTLHGQGRITRRSTLYRAAGDRWQAVFHQGTVVR